MAFSNRSLSVVGMAALLFALSIRIPSNPPTPRSRSLFSQAPVPPVVANSLKIACANCHSNETVWPWYVHLPVVSVLIVHEVERAREHLNFSDWQSVREKGPEELAAGFSGICQNLLSGAMPKRSYLRMHPEAHLSKAEVGAVCAWIDKQRMQALASGR